MTDAPEQAARNFAVAIALSPGNEVLAARALSTALAAGDEPLAVSAARALDAAGKLPPEGRILLIGEAAKAGRWKEAEAEAGKLRADAVFGFAVPILRAWIAVGSKQADPIALLDAAKDSQFAAAYAPEQRALLLLARGNRAEGVAALQPLLKDVGLRSARLRIAAAVALARAGDRTSAEQMLEGDSAVIGRARTRLAEGRLTGAIATPAEGIADFLMRISVDLAAQQVPELALSFARIGTFIAPGDAEAWMLTSELLGARGRHDSALAALGHIAPDDPLAENADDERLSLLVDADRQQEAIARAQAAAAHEPGSLDAWVRLGEVLAQADHYGEAADAFGHALGLNTAGASAARPRWTLLLLQANALTQAGKWPEAKAALEEAHKLAPDQAMVLNYLGYGQLERRENLVEAEQLIREASRLQPDDAAITDSLGWALYVRGDVPRAIALLEKAAQGQPADAAINEHLGDAYYTAGRRYEARYAWRAALVYADGKASERLRAKIDEGLSPGLSAP
jgi:tetratricopeptide (TPR) repeat protein